MQEQYQNLIGKKILIVDDEPLLQEVLGEELKYHGAEIAYASCTSEALNRLANEDFRIVISDIRMPGEDGVVLLDKIKSVSVENPIVVLISGFSDYKVDEILHRGAGAFFNKPYEIDELLESLVHLLK